MLLSKKSVELLAPAGTWEVLEAAIAAGFFRVPFVAEAEVGESLDH